MIFSCNIYFIKVGGNDGNNSVKGVIGRTSKGKNRSFYCFILFICSGIRCTLFKISFGSYVCQHFFIFLMEQYLNELYNSVFIMIVLRFHTIIPLVHCSLAFN